MSTMTLNAPKTLLILFFASASLARGQDPPSEETIAFYEQNCMSCHTIGGGRLTGPDLKGVSERQTREWLVGFILDPKKVIDSGDTYAAEILRESRGALMTKVPGIDRTLAEKLLSFIDAESAKETSRYAGLQVSDRPLTDADIARGRRLFLGKDRFEGGAPACVACHTVNGLGGLGGGRLGPDLTSAYARLEGRNALAAWLSAPPSAVMQPVYRKHPVESEEILALVAFLKNTAESGSSDAPPATLSFLLAGFGGAIALLLVFDFLWRKRYRAVRRPLASGRLALDRQS
ncbi:MAG: cytochrome c [bacterium]|nr:cytochrome c [bacterium]